MLASKPGHPDAVFDAQSMPTFGPESDLFDVDPGLTTTKVNSTHLLVLNRYCVFRPQYLILTLDSYNRQTEPLYAPDFAAAWNVLHSSQLEHFVIYNCGPEVGCSRLHMHMQIPPKPKNFVFFPDVRPKKRKLVPYRYCLQTLEDTLAKADNAAKVLSDSYQELWSDARNLWQNAGEVDTGYFPHNVVLTKDWLVVVPRRRYGI